MKTRSKIRAVKTGHLVGQSNLAHLLASQQN